MTQKKKKRKNTLILSSPLSYSRAIISLSGQCSISQLVFPSYEQCSRKFTDFPETRGPLNKYNTKYKYTPSSPFSRVITSHLQTDAPQNTSSLAAAVNLARSLSMTKTKKEEEKKDFYCLQPRTVTRVGSPPSILMNTPGLLVPKDHSKEQDRSLGTASHNKKKHKAQPNTRHNNTRHGRSSTRHDQPHKQDPPHKQK
jgi:hypothetical protein